VNSVFQLLKYNYRSYMKSKFSTLQIFQHKLRRSRLTVSSNKTVLYRIRMCERVACKNFAVHVKRSASPGNFVLTSCVSRRDRNSTERHAASKSPGRPQVVIWLRSRSSGEWYIQCESYWPYVTYRWYPTGQHSGRRGTCDVVWRPAQFLSFWYTKPLVLWILR
jgi:hypothetical protein